MYVLLFKFKIQITSSFLNLKKEQNLGRERSKMSVGLLTNGYRRRSVYKTKTRTRVHDTERDWFCMELREIPLRALRILIGSMLQTCSDELIAMNRRSNPCYRLDNTRNVNWIQLHLLFRSRFCSAPSFDSPPSLYFFWSRSGWTTTRRRDCVYYYTTPDRLIAKLYRRIGAVGQFIKRLVHNARQINFSSATNPLYRGYSSRQRRLIILYVARD